MAKARRRSARSRTSTPARRASLPTVSSNDEWEVVDFPKEFRVIKWDPAGLPGFVKIKVGYKEYIADLHSKVAYRVSN